MASGTDARYDEGGWLPPVQIEISGSTLRPERRLTPAQIACFMWLMEMAYPDEGDTPIT